MSFVHIHLSLLLLYNRSISNSVKFISAVRGNQSVLYWGIFEETLSIIFFERVSDVTLPIITYICSLHISKLSTFELVKMESAECTACPEDSETPKYYFG